MSDMFPPSLDEMIACAEREIAMRERVYPKWVASGRMKQEKADREIECMRAIAGNLHKQKKEQANV